MKLESDPHCLMVLGTSSGAGKSLLATALCAWYARQGIRVAPFKAQNMSNNARVVAGGEIGAAQYFQALAAGVEPDVRMNPVLLKPESDTHSQVIVRGQVDRAMAEVPWRERGDRLWPIVRECFDALKREHDAVVIEGAGSPAEINLMASDFVNLRMARHADARCLLVSDVDRGGAFAHLYGTWALLDAQDRARIDGFVLNKFRGDAALLAPGPQQLEALTGVPTLAVLPMWREHGLPEEDGVFEAGAVDPRLRGEDRRMVIAIVAYPRVSNLDEFQPLQQVARIVWARTPAQLEGADWIVLPGSKHTASDLAWLRSQGLDRAIASFAQRGGQVLGVCGGLQMLGEALVDRDQVDGNGPGLGLLPLVTQFERDKMVRRTSACFGEVRGAWSALSGIKVRGYEIHHGRTVAHPAMAAPREVLHAGVCRENEAGNANAASLGQRKEAANVPPASLGWQNEAGNVLGLYVHGLFEDACAMRALFGVDVPALDRVFDGLAAFVQYHFGERALLRLIGRG